MNTLEKKLEKILTKESDLYIIPAYQRAYSWSMEDAEKLIEDTYLVYKENKNSDFYLGSLICIKKENEIFEVVDGQQRLITLTILFSAIELLLEDKSNLRKKNDLRNRITYEDEYGNICPKICVRKKDYEFYKKYIMFCDEENKQIYPKKEIKNLPLSQRNMINNFNTIYSYLEDIVIENNNSYDIVIDFLNYLLRKVSFIQITTEDLNSSFRLFNVLNSRGLPLTYSDLFKSLLFEKINEKEKNKLKEAEESWDKMEDDIGLEYMNSFLLAHCISNKEKNEIQNTKILNSYKKLIEEKNTINNIFYEQPSKMLEHILNSYNVYMKIKNNEFRNGQISKILYGFNNSIIKGATAKWLPLVIKLFIMLEKKIYTDKEIENFLNIFEKLYYSMVLKRTRSGEVEAVISDILISLNLNKNLQETINLMKEKYKKYSTINSSDYEYLNFGNKSNFVLWKAFLIRLELEYIEENLIPDFSSISIEHILPKTMNKYWSQIFNKNEHNEYVNNIGNIALLKLERNSSAKNASFETKKEKYKEYQRNKSIFSLTESISNYEIWNKESIEKRNAEIISLIKMFLSI